MDFYLYNCPLLFLVLPQYPHADTCMRLYKHVMEGNNAQRPCMSFIPAIRIQNAPTHALCLQGLLDCLRCLRNWGILSFAIRCRNLKKRNQTIWKSCQSELCTKVPGIRSTGAVLGFAIICSTSIISFYFHSCSFWNI